MKQMTASVQSRRAHRFLGMAMLALLAAACSPEPEVSKCAKELFPSYNPKNREQCIAVCIRCDKGVTTTCATACSLKGAR